MEDLVHVTLNTSASAMSPCVDNGSGPSRHKNHMIMGRSDSRAQLPTLFNQTSAGGNGNTRRWCLAAKARAGYRIESGKNSESFQKQYDQQASEWAMQLIEYQLEATRMSRCMSINWKQRVCRAVFDIRSICELSGRTTGRLGCIGPTLPR